MNEEQVKLLIQEAIQSHEHDGIGGKQINYFDIFGEAPSTIVVGEKGSNRDAHITIATIATTGNADGYIIAPTAGTLESVDFSAVDALAANDTNYITWTITNLGQAGAGSTVMLAATDANTTKATGGSAISANTKKSLTMNTTGGNLVVAAGDRLLIRAAVTNTLANSVTFPTYLLRFICAPTSTISRTGSTDFYIIAPINGRLTEADFSGTSALAASDTNYITFTITNLGRDGAGTTVLLAATNANTTKSTGGTALSVDTVRELVITATYNNIQKGDRLKISAAVTGTLANTVTNSVFTLRFK